MLAFLIDQIRLLSAGLTTPFGSSFAGIMPGPIDNECCGPPPWPLQFASSEFFSLDSEIIPHVLFRRKKTVQFLPSPPPPPPPCTSSTGVVLYFLYVD